MTSRWTFWVGILASVSFLVILAVLLTDVGQIVDSLRQANLWYLLPALALYFAAVQARSVRWTFLLRPLLGRPRRAIYPVVVIGYMANNLIPVRIGEVIRSYYLSLREDVSAAATFGTVAVERASDVLALLFFFGLAAVFIPVSGTLDRLADEIPGGEISLVVVAVLPFLVVATAVLLATAVRPETTLAFVDRFTAFLPERLHTVFVALASRLLQGLTVVRSPRGLMTVFLLSLPVWALEAGMYYLIALGFDLRAAFDSQLAVISAIMVFTAAANLAGVFPSSAGSWGPFDFFGALALIALGVSAAEATAYAVTVHATLWLPVTLLGLVLLLRDGRSLQSLIRGARKKHIVPEEHTPGPTSTESGTAR